jgi:hypothetical protein
MPRPALYGRRVLTEGQPNPYPDPSRPLDGNVELLLCELSRLPNHTEGGITFSRLPAPQTQTHGEEQIVMIGLSPRLEGHSP